jgi:hypothetical protein
MNADITPMNADKDRELCGIVKWPLTEAVARRASSCIHARLIGVHRRDIGAHRRSPLYSPAKPKS